ELKNLGADACAVDGPSLADAVKAHTGGTPIRLGLDAVSGQATSRLASCVADGGVVCTYGSMSGEDPVMPRGGLLLGGPRPGGVMPGRPRPPRRAAPAPPGHRV